jgi:hypothetical protein
MGILSSIGDFFSGIMGDIIGFLVGVDFDDVEDQAQGALVNKQSNIDPIPVVYGKRKVGGVRVFVSTGGGKKNEYLYIALVLCEGEIEAIDEVYINDKISTHNDYNGLLQIDKKLGTDGQLASGVLVGGGGDTPDDTWGASHKLSGVAYLGIRIKYDGDVFGGIPEIQCVIRGRKVYDPRTATTAYSTNPALCLRDYLTNARYGKGLPSSAINDTMFGAAATYYDDTTVTPYSGGSDINLMDCNARLDTGKTIFNNVKELLQGMRGLLPYSDGQYGLIVDQAASSTFDLTPHNITSDITVQNAGKGKRFNRVIAKFPNPDANWQQDSVTFPKAGSSDETTFLNEDNGEELIRNITLNTITSIYQARDIARIVCLASRKNVNAVSLKATSEALNIAVGDVVNLEHPSLGWTGSATQNMRVTATQLLSSGEVNLSLLEYNGSIYPFAQGDEALDNQDTSLPNPFEVGAPQAPITATERVILGPDGTYQSAITLDWAEADDAFVNEYEVQWKKSTDSVYENNARTEETEIDIFNLEVNQTPGSEITYNFRVRSINTLGVRSGFLSLDFALDGDVTPPAQPDDLNAEGGINSITFTWDNPSDSDFKHCEVYVNTINTIPANPTSIIDGEIYTQIGLNGGDRRYFWLKSVDFSGNKSAATSSVNDVALNVTGGDIEPGDIAGRGLSMLLNVYADGVSANSGEGALVGVNLDGTPDFDSDGFIYYDGEKITVEHDQYTNSTGSFTFLTHVAEKQGFIVFDINKTKPFTITNGPTNMDCAFVWVEDDVYYYDTNTSSASFNPDTITGTTTGTDYKTGASTTSPHLVAIGAIRTTSNSAGDDIIAGGLFAEPIDLRATEIAEGVIVGRHIAADTIGANKLTVNNLASISADLGTINAGTINAADVDITNLTVNNLAGDVTTIDTFTATNVPFQVQSTYTRSMVSIASQTHAYRPFVTINATAQLQDNITVWGELQMRENNTSGKVSIGTVTGSFPGELDDFIFFNAYLVMATSSTVSVGDLVGLTSDTSASYKVVNIVEFSAYLAVYVTTTTGGIVLSAPPTGAYSKFPQTAAWITVSKSYVVERSGPSWKPMSFQGALPDSTTNSVDVQIVFYRSGTTTNSTATPPTTTSGSKKFGIINIQGTVMLAR